MTGRNGFCIIQISIKKGAVFVSVLLVLLGAIPFALGRGMDWFMWKYPNTAVPYVWLGVAVLLLWGLLAFVCHRPGKTDKKWTVACLNMAGALVVALLFVQMVLGQYWPNAVGMWTQMYFLPVLRIGFLLTPWFHRVFFAYLAGYLLMLLAAWAGCTLREKSR